MTDPVTRDPAHPDFPHGTTRGYQRGCHNPVCCGKAWRQLHRDYRASQRARNPRTKIPADPTRHRLNVLLDNGWTVRGIAAAVGVTKGCINLILRPDRAHVTQVVAHKVGRLTPDDLTPTMVPARRPVAQLRALAANGWTHPQLAALAGCTVDQLVIRPTATVILAVRAERVDRLYRLIGDRQSTSAYTRTLARKHGWYPPICYDDDMRLIPEAIPTTRPATHAARDAQAAANRADYARVRLNVLRHVLNGDYQWEAAEQEGVAQKTAERYCQEAGLGVDTPWQRRRRLRRLCAEAEVCDEDDLYPLWEQVVATEPSDQEEAA